MRGLILCLCALALVVLFTPQAQAGPLLERLGFGGPCANGACAVNVEVKAAVVKPPAAVKTEKSVKVEKTKTVEAAAVRGRVREFVGKIFIRRR